MLKNITRGSSAEACNQAYYLPILAVMGLACEARLTAGRGVITINAGADPVRLRAMLDARTWPGCRAAISIGIAGGLDPGLKPGSIVIATGVAAPDRHYPIPSTLTTVLANKLSGHSQQVVLAELVGVDAPVLTPSEKGTLRQQTGAAAADMESHVVANFAVKHALPFAAIRVVCDPAHRLLPPFIGSAVQPNGGLNFMAVAGALATGSANLGGLVQLGQDFRAALKALSYCRRALSQDLEILT